MKIIKIISIVIIVSYFLFYIVLQDGDAKKGKLLFNNPSLAGGTIGNSCASCHPDGKGLEEATDKKAFNLAGRNQNSIEEAINVCITNALKGQAIDPESKEMKDLVAYIKSLRKK